MTETKQPGNAVSASTLSEGRCSGTEHYHKLIENILDQLSNPKNYNMEQTDDPDNSGFIIKSSFSLIETNGISKAELSENDPNYLTLINIKECAHATVIALKKIKDTNSDGQLVLGNINYLLRTTLQLEDHKKKLTVDFIFPDATSTKEVSDFIKKNRNDILTEAKLHFRPSGHMLQ